MNMKMIALSTCAIAVLTACGGQTSDSDTITVEPNLNKVAKLGDVDIKNTKKFAYNNATDVDWSERYAACAGAAGIIGDIQLALKDYGTATTIDMVKTSNVSDLQRAQAFGCMERFAAKN